MTSRIEISDRPLLGITLMLGFCVVAPLADGVGKILGAYMGIGQLVLVRFVAQLVILAPIVMMFGRFRWPQGRLAGLMWLRTVFHIIGIGLMFLSLRYLPLADAIAIVFVMPFILLILGHFILGELVGPRRIIACAVGFAGTLMVVQPSFAEVGWPALIPLVVAVDFAFFILVTRAVAKAIDPLELQAVSGLMALVIVAPLMVMSSPFDVPDLGFSMPESTDWVLIIALGALGTFGHLLMTWALRYAPSATLAPMQYLEIPFAALFGWLIFREFPNGLALLGIAVTICAGLYILIRERAATPSEPQARSEAPHAGE